MGFAKYYIFKWYLISSYSWLTNQYYMLELDLNSSKLTQPAIWKEEPVEKTKKESRYPDGNSIPEFLFLSIKTLSSQGSQ